MSNNKTLTHDEKLALAAKIVGQMELGKVREKDGYDVLAITAQLYFPGRLVKLMVGDISGQPSPERTSETLVTIN